jgi:cyclopropane fatty-acyl-phospholipid synthase-like methyltransferase
MIYRAVNAPVLIRVPPDARRVLDVGCGSGALGHAIKRLSPTEVVGVTRSEEEADSARTVLDEVVCADLESADLTHLGIFDCIVCSHVLEHVRDPAELLARLLDRARRLIAAFEAAAADGAGAVAFEGSMIDLPVVIRAQRLLERAGSWTRSGGGN